MGRMVTGVLAVAFFLMACTSNNTTVVVAPESTAPGTMATPGTTSPSVGPSPPTHAIDEACATLNVHLNNLAKQLKGTSPITRTVEEEFVLAAKQLDGEVPALQGTDAASELGNVADDARRAGNYNGTSIGDLLNFVSTFANHAKTFVQTYCS
jgi:hypothetical protein